MTAGRRAVVGAADDCRREEERKRTLTTTTMTTTTTTMTIAMGKEIEIIKRKNRIEWRGKEALEGDYEVKGKIMRKR